VVDEEEIMDKRTQVWSLGVVTAGLAGGFLAVQSLVESAPLRVIFATLGSASGGMALYLYGKFQRMQ
jgi:hypothetical protein